MLSSAINLESQFQVDEDTPCPDAAMSHIRDIVAAANKEWQFDRDGNNGVIKTKHNKLRVCYRNCPTSLLGNKLTNSIIIHRLLDYDLTFEEMKYVLEDMLALRRAAKTIDSERPWADYMTVVQSGPISGKS